MAEAAAVDDFLAHYGVTGMKWGKTKGATGGSGKPAKVKTSQADIHLARQRQAARQMKFQSAQGDLMVARTAKGQDKAEKIMRQLEHDYFNSADAKTAAKATTGEKWAIGLTLSSIGLYAIAIAGNAAR